MMKGVVHEFDLNSCNKSFAHPIHKLESGVTKDFVCAANRKVHVDTCEGRKINVELFEKRSLNAEIFLGDSGSGLMIKNYDIFYVYGVTSFGVSCEARKPSFYTRVSSYLQWIESIVWP